MQGKARKFVIGNHVRIISCRRYNPLGGAKITLFSLGSNSEVIIGNNVGISNASFKLVKGIQIDDNVNIGGDCKFYDSNMHSVEYKYRMEQPDTHIKSAPIHIKEGAWIGAHCIVLKGVTIGARSVIGAGAVVTKDVPDDEVWGGNPATFIKKLDV
jgi:acetyltransferase-like isoleucine patch superfamily enzyme